MNPDDEKDLSLEDEEEDLPRFECRLQIPPDVSPGVRTLIEQQDISRQLTELLYRKSSRAIKLALATNRRIDRAESRAERNEKRIAALEQFKWKATWIGALILAGLEVGLRFLLK